MIEIALPRTRRGVDIVERFRSASTVTIDDNHAWQAFVKNNNYKYTARDGLVVISQSVESYSLFKGRKYLFAGPMRWQYGSGRINLEPVNLDEEYDQVQVSVGASRFRPGTDIREESADPKDQIFQPYSEGLTRILNEFLSKP